MIELDKRIQDLLHEDWRSLRDSFNHIYEVLACINFIYRAGLITNEQQELWIRRLNACPGHDDEGGRSWCAYCGDMHPDDYYDPSYLYFPHKIEGV